MDLKTARSPSLSDLMRSRKQIETDAQLLKNRIKLLQLEEQRTLKKIHSTRKQVRTVIAAKRRDDNRHHLFAQLRLATERQISQKHEQNQRLRESLRSDHLQSTEALRERNRKKVLTVKKLLVEEREKRNRAIAQIQAENFTRAKAIQSERKEAVVRVHSLSGQKKAKVRELYYERLSEEERRVQEREQEVMTMEMLEMELIEKLKTTQILQQQASEALETAIGRGNSMRNSR